MPSRVLVIGLDGADGDLLASYCDRDITPTLAGLRTGGLSGALIKPPGLSDDALWSNFATARTIGEHGRYHGPNQHSRTSYRSVHFSKRPMEDETFWSRLSGQGRSVAVLDVPKCPLAEDLHGLQVADWLVHGKDREQPVSVPATIADDIVTRFGAAPESPCSQYSFVHGIPFHHGLSNDEIRHWVRTLATSAGMKRAASSYYLARERWDLFVTVFKELHCAGHLLWDLIDPNHPEYDPRRNEAAERPFETLYREIDAAVASLIDAAGDGATVIVFSPHGMRANASPTGMFEELLKRMNTAFIDGRGGIAGRVLNWLVPRLPRRGDQYYAYALSCCFPVNYNECAGAVRINLQGREPAGTVAPGVEFERMKQRIADELQALRYEETGVPVVQEVVDMQSAHRGGRSAELPDLLALWTPVRETRPVISTSFGRLDPPSQRLRPGGHDDCGFYMTAAPEAGPADGDDMSIDELASLIERLVADAPADASDRGNALPKATVRSMD